MIKINHLKRAYGDFVAVNDVSFSIEKGEIVGLLGHNGAGKTTIMKMLSGFLEASAGTIEIDGFDMASHRSDIQQQLGYLPESLPIYPEMSVADYLDYAANLKGLNGEEARHEIRHAIKATQINSKLLSPITTLSRGYKQRVGVAQAIIGKPKLLILDEPTNGLDPTQTQHMRELIREIAKEATVILSTHIMQEVDALCDRALIIRGGELAMDARLEALRHSNQLILNSDLPPTKATPFFAAINEVKGVNSEALAKHYRYNINLNEGVDIDSASNLVAKTLIEQGYALYSLNREQRDLESVFREVNAQSTHQEESHAA